jgi:hypothetical protein
MCPVLDAGDEVEAYVKIYIGNVNAKTDVMPRSSLPEWNTECLLCVVRVRKTVRLSESPRVGRVHRKISEKEAKKEPLLIKVKEDGDSLACAQISLHTLPPVSQGKQWIPLYSEKVHSCFRRFSSLTCVILRAEV